MQHREFLDRVADRGRLPSTEYAQRVTEATLQTLSERVLGTEAQQLASNLPTELVGALRTDGEAATFDLDEFLDRVDQRAGLDGDNVLQAAQAVVAATHDAVPDGEFGDVVSQLPTSYEPLLAMAGGMPGRKG